MPLPAMSWVLPTYNREAWLGPTIDSIRNQTEKHIEIIVLDDGSTDYTHELVGSYAAEDDRIKYVRFDDRRGAARCRNHGNKMAGSSLVHCADAGDLYHKTATKVALGAFRKNPSMDVFYSAVGIITDRGQYAGNQPAFPYKPGEKINFSHPTVVYKRSLVVDRFCYRELSVHTDLYESLFLEMAKAGAKFGFSKYTLVMKRVIEDDSARDVMEALKLRKGVYEEFGLRWPFGKLPDS